jgi:diaminopimelate decarboxylase
MPHTLPWTALQFAQLAAEYGTPLYLYDAAGMRAVQQRLTAAMSWMPGFRNYFAVKALPNPQVLALLAAEGSGADCSSSAELELARRIGLSGGQIMLTSNNTSAETFARARALNALINLDDGGHLATLAELGPLPEWLSFRYNPGASRRGSTIIGHPAEAKFGMPREALFAAYAAARDVGVQRFGLHTMIVSNQLELSELTATAEMLFSLARELMQTLQITIDLINLGGGIGIPYRPEQSAVDLEAYGRQVAAHYAAYFPNGSLQPRVVLECGRLISGPHGYLLTRVRQRKQSWRTYLGVDANMANLMRPGMYGAYHRVTNVSAAADRPIERVDVVGSLCENNDKFAIERDLPAAAVGDLLVIHDAGAHGHAMGFNYNGSLRSAEVLVEADGSRLIRRAETLDDLFATICWA